MSKRRVYQFAQQNLATAALILGPRANRGYRIHDIGCIGVGAGQGVVVTVNDVRSIFIPCITDFSNVAYPKFIAGQTAGLLEQLNARFPGLPQIIAGSDEAITFERRNTASACTVYVWYEELDGQDIPDPTAPGGSLNDERIIIQHCYQSFTVGIGATSIVRMSNNNMPSGFRSFPFAEVVPSNRTMNLLGICSGADLSGGGDITVNGIRIWREEQSILSDEESFCPHEVFPYTLSTGDKRLGLMREPIPFIPNDEMKVEYSLTNAGVAAEDALMFTSLIFHQKPV